MVHIWRWRRWQNFEKIPGEAIFIYYQIYFFDIFLRGLGYSFKSGISCWGEIQERCQVRGVSNLAKDKVTGAEEDDRKGLKLSHGPRPGPAPGGAGGSVWIGGGEVPGAGSDQTFHAESLLEDRSKQKETESQGGWISRPAPVFDEKLHWRQKKNWDETTTSTNRRCHGDSQCESW